MSETLGSEEIGERDALDEEREDKLPSVETDQPSDTSGVPRERASNRVEALSGEDNPDDAPDQETLEEETPGTGP